MNPLNKVLRELEIRWHSRYAILSSLYDYQRKLAESQARRIAVLSSRRAGKSRTILLIMLSMCASTPNSNCLFLGITRASVKRTILGLIGQLRRELNIKFTINLTELIIYFPNGSKIEISGADGTEKDSDRYAGSHYDLVAIDEAGSFDPIMLLYLIDEVIFPALMDKLGKLILIGSPRHFQTGPFYEATTGNDNWESHFWDTYDNLSMRKQYNVEIERLKQENPDVDIWTIPKIIREYKGKWARDTERLVYYIPETCYIDKFEPSKKVYYVLGIDLGYRDATAMTIMAWEQYQTNCYVLESYKIEKATIDMIAQNVKQLQKKYKNPYIAVDTAGSGALQICQHLGEHFSIYTNPAIKTAKEPWIELLNSKYRTAKVLILKDKCNDLIKECEKLPWKTIGNKRIEHPSFDNHCADSTLYSFKHIYSHFEVEEIKETEDDKILREHDEWIDNQDIKHYGYEE